MSGINPNGGNYGNYNYSSTPSSSVNPQHPSQNNATSSNGRQAANPNSTQTRQYLSTQQYLAAYHGTYPTQPVQAQGLTATAPAAPVPSPQEIINTTGARLVGTAQANMQHGRLDLTSSYTSSRGQLFYRGTYTPHMAFPIAGTTFRDFAPGQDGLSNEHLEFYRDEFNEGANAQIDPVELAPTEQGQLGVVDGHHRLAAGISLGKSIPVLINLDTEPAEATDWSRVGLNN